jgi:hypothetical protein
MPKRVRLSKAVAFRRGVLGGNRTWFNIWVALTAFGWVRRQLTKQDTNVARVRLEPGHQLLITHEPPLPRPSRRQRRREAAAGS